MPRKKSEATDANEVKEVKEETVVEKPALAQDFEYQNTGNVPYDLPKEVSVIELKAQVPFRMSQNEVKTVTTGLKVRIPEGYVGIITGDPDPKTQVEILGSPVILEPTLEMQEVMVTLKMFGYIYKIYNMGMPLGYLTLIPAKTVKAIKK